MVSSLPFRERDRALSRAFIHRFDRERNPASAKILQGLPSAFVPVKRMTSGTLRTSSPLERFDNTERDLIAARDAAEDINE